MPRYVETSGELGKLVNEFMESFVAPAVGSCGVEGMNDAAVQLGHIVNLAIRCNPRAVQHTVRRNIVQIAMKKYCIIGMKEVMDETTGVSYNKIKIMPRH